IFGREKGIEDHAELLGGDANAGVADVNLGHIRSRVVAEVDGQPAATQHGLAGIDDEVEQNLFNLATNNWSFWPAAEALFDLDMMFRQILFAKDQDFFNQTDEVGNLTGL